MTAAVAESVARVHRFEVWPKAAMMDARGDAICRAAHALNLPQTPQRIDAGDVYLVEGDLDDQQVQRIAHQLLADPVTQSPVIGATPPPAPTPSSRCTPCPA